MAAFTSTQTGDWDDAATWGGGGTPGTGDTATISADHVVTIPALVAIICGAIAVAAGSGGRTNLVINGTLDLEGDITMNGVTALAMGPGSTLDLNGNTVATAATDVQYNFAGAAMSHVSIISTGSPGSFTIGAHSTIPTWIYVDVTGLDDSAYGRTHPAPAGFVSYQFCTFNACGKVTLDATGTGANVGFLVANCDFRNPVTPASDDYPQIYQTSVIGTQERTVRDCTWSDDVVGSAAAYARFRFLGGTIEGCVFHNFKIRSQENATEANKNVLRDCAIYNDVGGDIFPNTEAGFRQVASNYFLYDDGDHPFAGSGSASRMTLRGNVLEGTGVGINWLLGFVCEVDFLNNIALGLGNVFAYTADGTAAIVIDIKGNTFFVENSGQIGSGIYFAPVLLTEQLATNLAGTVSVTDNILPDPDSTDTKDRMIDLLGATADQIDTLDFNVGWSWPGGAPTPAVKYGANVNVTSGVGANDSAVDPDFVDRTRTFATWDALLGGAGTAANAISELLKLNESGYDAAYTPRAAVRYVFEGFKTQAAGLRNNAQDGGSHGAANFEKAGRSQATITSYNSYVAGIYTA